MEPTGIMGQCKPNAAPKQRTSLTGGIGDNTARASGYQVCDLADEEVHFSRDPLDSVYYYYSYDRNNNEHIPSSLSGGTAPADYASFTELSPTGATQANSNVDQLRSTRLLNFISSKLKRGSNYLNASKVVGQYLLGITIQSWSEFFNTSRMMKAPGTRHQLTRRLLANLSYFQGNYLCVSLILVIYCILTSPLLLLAIVVYLLALYLVTARSALGKQTRIFGHRLNLQQQYSFITMLSLPPLWIAGAPSALFWVIGASFFVVGLHASMYANERALAAELSSVSATSSSSVLSLQAAAGPSSAGRNQCTVSGGSGYSKLDSPPPARVGKSIALTQYYNHYAASSVTQRVAPQDSQQNHTYGLMSSYQAPTPTSTQLSAKRNSAAGYMPIALSQWITFGGISRPSFGGNPESLEHENHKDEGHNQPRMPEINIISQDYAGLGRVYEV